MRRHNRRFVVARVGVSLAMIAACSSEPSAPFCGDGVLDPDEACDDGNRESGDACTSTCQIPGTQLECTTLIEGADHDKVNVLLSLPDLSFVAAGGKYSQDRQLGWIGQYDESGVRVWQTWPPPADDWSDSIIDIDAAPSESDGYWALLARGPDEDLIHLDDSGTVVTRLFLPTLVQAAGSWVSAQRLLIIDQDVWLAGNGGDGTPEDPDLWVGRFDPQTQVLSTVHIEDHAGFYDKVWAVARSESEVAVAATVDTSPSVDGDEVLVPHSNVLVIRFDFQGQEVGRHLLGSPDPETATSAHSIAADGTGGWIVGGEQHSLTSVFGREEAWMARVQPSEGRMWTWTSGGSPSGDVVNDILVTDREVVAVGMFYAESKRRPWLVGLGLDGAKHWEHTFDVPGYAETEVSAVVLDRANRLRIANNAWNDDGASLLQSCLVAW